MANTTVERPAEDDIQGQELLHIYRLMLLTRRLESRCTANFTRPRSAAIYIGMTA